MKQHIRRKAFLFALFAAGLWGTGCIQVDYVGQKFPETPMTQEVRYFTESESVDTAEYLLIGRFTLNAKNGTDGYDIQKKLMEKAREYGGDAVHIISLEREKRGTYTRNKDEFGVHPAVPQTPEDKERFGELEPLDEERRTETRVIVRALLYKKRAEALRLLNY